MRKRIRRSIKKKTKQRRSYKSRVSQVLYASVTIDIKQSSSAQQFLAEFLTDYKRLCDTYPKFILSSGKTLTKFSPSAKFNSPQHCARTLIGVDNAPTLVDFSVSRQWCTLTIKGAVSMIWVGHLLMHLCRYTNVERSYTYFSYLPCGTPCRIATANRNQFWIDFVDI